MSIWSSLFAWLNDDFSGTDIGEGNISSVTDESTCINPASGLPMIDGSCGVDVGGNPYGCDLHDTDYSPSASESMWDDSFSSSASESMWDDGLSSSSSSMFDDGFSMSSWDD